MPGEKHEGDTQTIYTATRRLSSTNRYESTCVVEFETRKDLIMFKLKNGEAAPEVHLTDVRGDEWRLSDQRGKMVILHFCRGEF
jgi:hypothetical protein